MRRLARLRRNEDGATLVEFALILPTLALLLMGTLDFGYQSYLRSMANGVLQDAARRSSFEGATSEDTDNYIRENLKEILPASVRNDPDSVAIVKKSYYNFSNIGKPEKLTVDDNSDGNYDEDDDCYEDANGNTMYDEDTGEAGLGGSDDIVYYEVTVAVPRLFPLHNLIGVSPTQTATTKAIVRNQPFDGEQDVPDEICPDD